MRVVYGQDDAVAEWVSARTGDVIVPPFVAIGFTRDDRVLCGGVVLTCWNGSNLDIALASERGFTKENIQAVYSYAFVQLKANRMTSYSRRSNKVMHALLPRLGFVGPEGVLRKFYGLKKADDAFVYALFADRARRWTDGIEQLAATGT